MNISFLTGTILPVRVSILCILSFFNGISSFTTFNFMMFFSCDQYLLVMQEGGAKANEIFGKEIMGVEFV